MPWLRQRLGHGDEADVVLVDEEPEEEAGRRRIGLRVDLEAGAGRERDVKFSVMMEMESEGNKARKPESTSQGRVAGCRKGGVQEATTEELVSNWIL